MNNRMKIIGIFIIALVIIMTLNGCVRKKNTTESNESQNKEVTSSKDYEIFDEDIDSLSAWIAYWDLNVQGEIDALNNELKEVSYFAAYFNSDNELIIPEDLINYYNKTRNKEYIKYLTIVNDKINSDGTSSLKDTELLKEVLSDSSSRSNHIKDIITLASKYNFHGIEIDYEQIKDDMELWNKYLLFIKELYNAAKESGFKVKVVLEPNTPFDKLEFVEGPTYVMMCYNLHGGFSEPGEKANPKFINELINKMETVPGNKSFAIATGGFNWASDGKVTSLSEREAKELVKDYSAEEIRHDESNCLVFKYTDKAGVNHEVWYADKNTLGSWMKIINDNGYGVSLWKLGGNVFN